jgi:phage-related protein
MLAINAIKLSVGHLLRTISGIIDFVTGVFTGDWKKAWGGIQTIFGGIINDIKTIFKAAIDFIWGKIQWVISKVEWVGKKVKGVMDKIPSVGLPSFSMPKFKLPFFAEGGIVTKPTLGMVGEGGESEAIIPLSKLDKFINGGGGKNVTVNITGNHIASDYDVDRMMDKVVKKLRYEGVY